MAALFNAGLLALNATVNAIMRGVVWEGNPFNIVVKDVPVPVIINQTDVIVRLTTVGICGSDFISITIPWTMGHEGAGIVVETGSAVGGVKVGDRVIIPDTADDGHVHGGLSPPNGMLFGNGQVLGGTQAKYARVPFADANPLPIPQSPSVGNSSANNDLDWLMISDIFATAWGGLDYAGFQSGDSVAIFGARPVGILTAYSAFLRGATHVYVVDSVPSSLSLAASVGAVPISFSESDPVAQTMALEPNWVKRTIDCVGFKAVNAEMKTTQNIVMNNMVALTTRLGGMCGVGVWPSSAEKNAAAPLADTISAAMDFNYGEFWGKGLSLRAGGIDVVPYLGTLVEMVASGKAKPGFVVSSVIGIEDALDGYAKFSRHEEQKVVIRFPWI
ncbi:hypothetical protein HYALB_00010029 [Hymenoscyphus albidus]|uniref:Alcohol dehydrogenase-like N-terminal domain-containing protein n=1 Tax=Hymenoscyphus albidus TaxID=595503 RepID=A0A9N9LIL8_9HELO|nr:hypothetical protein HYALB_00010029 [Hymenoscyphus albidus]